MTERFREIYRTGTCRCRGYDYSLPGKYFVTVCTRKKIPYFGEIINGKMILTKTGIIVQVFWLEIPKHFPNVVLDEFVIMPDHLHGIIIIKTKSASKMNYNPQGIPILFNAETPNLGVSTKKSGNPYWKSNSVGSIINQFKRICTIKTKLYKMDLEWQPRFFDHIIRSKNEMNRIRSYIKNNPVKWFDNQS